MESIINIIIDAAAKVAAEDRELDTAALVSRIVAEVRAELERQAFTLSETEEILAKLANINVMALLDAIKRF